ncbi:hypothetical protein SAMN05877753_11253 [Bacillus oleivorans]|uniref:Uncharacterized protein n=1 Tax=Bacillus oleivorans TaxID=1448271 RepID=A0A285D6H0_9BACI|nr:hypothetical protein [Bacillus oleivorans]SNX75410.1 hypothetical protein SAMN05877753_11253 [Bacillus oleivorans]
MIISNVFAVVSLITATILGIFGQHLSYFLNDIIDGVNLSTYLTFITFISIALFIVVPILTFISKKVQKEMFVLYFIASVLIGIPVSFWSYFVWAMWMSGG